MVITSLRFICKSVNIKERKQGKDASNKKY